MTQPSVLVVGLGHMGAPMARSLARAGFSVAGWNRGTPAAAEGPAGFALSNDAVRALAQADIIILMLTDANAVEDFLFTPERLGALRVGSIVLDMGTSGPQAARAHCARLAAMGVAYLDAPVSGGVRGAENASLTILVGGDADVFARVKPVFEALGTSHHVGPIGAGQTAKLANQIIVTGYIAAVSEALLFAEQQALDPLTLVSALHDGFADSPVLRQHGERIARRDFAPGGASRLHLKDLGLIATAAGAQFGKLVNTVEARRRFEALVEGGHGELDHSAYFLTYEDRPV